MRWDGCRILDVKKMCVRRRHDGGGRTETIYDFKMMKMTLIAYFGYLSLCHSVYGVVNEPHGTENTYGGKHIALAVRVHLIRSLVRHTFTQQHVPSAHNNACE